MLRACSFTLALASRNEGLATAVERERDKVRGVEALGADIARNFGAAKDMFVRVQKQKVKSMKLTDSTQFIGFSLYLSPTKSDDSLCGLALSRLFQH
jgi:hypothetical protein